jgi:hypothetical protein
MFRAAIDSLGPAWIIRWSGHLCTTTGPGFPRHGVVVGQQDATPNLPHLRIASPDLAQ